MKVRYRGQATNTGQIVMLFVRAHLWLARKRLLHLLGEVRPWRWEWCRETTYLHDQRSRIDCFHHVYDGSCRNHELFRESLAASKFHLCSSIVFWHANVYEMSASHKHIHRHCLHGINKIISLQRKWLVQLVLV